MSVPAAAVLFDIDGTLLQTMGAGSRAVARVLREWMDTDVSDIGAEMAGRTDLDIFRKLLERLNVPYPEPPERRDLVRRYLRYLDADLEAKPPAACPGVPELLRALDGPHWHVGLVTGNLEAGAWVKLRHGKMDSFFTFGAFGSDRENRNDLVPLALRRLYRKHRIRVAPGAAIVVGDTLHDIACARAAGARVLAVGTGSGSEDELRAARPDAYLTDLRDTARVVGAFESILAAVDRSG